MVPCLHFIILTIKIVDPTKNENSKLAENYVYILFLKLYVQYIGFFLVFSGNIFVIWHTYTQQLALTEELFTVNHQT